MAKKQPSVLQRLETANEVVEAIGGTAAVRALTEAQSPQAVSNWLHRGFPSRLYPIMIAALNERGYTAPDSLWGVVSPAVAQGGGATTQLA